MNKLSLQDLQFEYPEAFINPIGFECGDGWFNIIQPMVAYICRHNKKYKSSQIHMTQVKEKYGTLRFYTNHETGPLSRMIKEAEAKSAVTCEQCGEPGKIRGRGWYYTACDEHTRAGDK